MQVNLSLTPGYRLKITRASRMSELVDRAVTSLAALGGSAAFLEILQRSRGISTARAGVYSYPWPRLKTCSRMSMSEL